MASKDPESTAEAVDALLAQLESYGLSLAREAAEDLIAERVRSVAELMRTTEATAQRYLTAEAIAGLAETIAFTLAEESPGADLYDAPRTAAVPINVIGRIVAALAEACQVRLAEHDDTHAAVVDAALGVTELVKCLSVLGSIASTEPTRPAADAAGIAGQSSDVIMAFPPALLRRVARYLDAAAASAEAGACPPGFDGRPEQLAETFRADALTVRLLAESAGPSDPSGPPPLRAL